MKSAVLHKGVAECQGLVTLVVVRQFVAGYCVGAYVHFGRRGVAIDGQSSLIALSRAIFDQNMSYAFVHLINRCGYATAKRDKINHIRG